MAIELVKLKIQSTKANIYHVPARQWRKWTEIARRVFNEVYSSMNGAQWVFLHPKQEKVSRSQWKTTAWNAAWTAAEAVMNQLREMSK